LVVEVRYVNKRRALLDAGSQTGQQVQQHNRIRAARYACHDAARSFEHRVAFDKAPYFEKNRIQSPSSMLIRRRGNKQRDDVSRQAVYTLADH
jgi:hypothetical protein